MTNNKGEFLLEDIPPGAHPAPTAGKPGFAAAREGSRIITLVPGEELRGLVLHLIPGGVIAGQIRDQDGDPAAGAVVRIARSTYKQGVRSLTCLGRAIADDQGNYRLAAVQPGRYYVSAQGVGEIPTSQKRADKREIDAQTFFPDSLELDHAKPLELEAGGEIHGADVRLRRAPVYDLHVKVLASAGAALNLMALELVSHDADGNVPERGKRIPTDGNVTFSNLPPGHYVARAFPMPVQSPQDLVGRLDFDIVDHSLDLDLSLTPGGVMEGTVTTEVLSTVPRMTFVLREWIGNYESTVSVGSIQNGKLHVAGLNTGPFLWEIPNLPNGTYVKSLRSGEHDFTNSMIDPFLVNGGLQILIGARVADISGKTQGEAVVLWPRTPNLGSYFGGVRVAAADQNAVFRFTGLAPGEYYIAAWNDLDTDLAMKSSEFLSHFNSEASPVTIAEGEHREIEPKLIPPARLAEELAKLP